MAYSVRNFKTKSAFKAAVINYVTHRDRESLIGRANYTEHDWQQESELYPPQRVYNPGLGGDLTNFTGTTTVEGPHYPEPHKWYATVVVKDGVVVSVK